MPSLLNTGRPPVFCPGCSHDTIVRALDTILNNMNIPGDQVVLVTDIGCSGLFDVFFHTHAFHGLHGRALTYAVGLKMAQPDLHVIVTMGDGGIGIGGAHILSACRRNLDITLLILNNFNFGMTGGQFSATTPRQACTSSLFLNHLEEPLDICRVAEAAGAPFVMRCSGLEGTLPDNMQKAISYKGFAIMEILAICPGRYSGKNRITPATIQEKLDGKPPYLGIVKENQRPEYGELYRKTAAEQHKPQERLPIDKRHTAPQLQKNSILLLGSAGQRVITAGELLCLAALSGGLQATQKNDYDITVLRGPSVSEIILWPEQVGYTGIDCPDIVLAISEDGVQRRGQVFSAMDDDGLIIHVAGLIVPDCRAEVLSVDFKDMGIGRQNWALAALAVMAAINRGISLAMLNTALKSRFSSQQCSGAAKVVAKIHAQYVPR